VGGLEVAAMPSIACLSKKSFKLEGMEARP